MDDSTLPGLLAGDPQNNLSDDARRRILRARYENEHILLDVDVYIEANSLDPDSEAAYRRRHAALFKYAKAVLTAIAEEYSAVASSIPEYRQWMSLEVEGACSSYRLSASQEALLRRLFSYPLGEIPSQKAPRSRSIVSASETVSIPESVGEQLRHLRDECRMTTEKLAEEVGVDPATVYRHISGKMRPHLPTIGTYERVFSKLLNRKVVIQITPSKRQ